MAKSDGLSRPADEALDSGEMLRELQLAMERSEALACELRTANAALEEKARQLDRISRYKSEFLANMSHELRTPLNSLLILSDQLARNPDANLTPRQVEFARTIHSSGTDLLALINDILDLSKIESGTVVLELRPLRLADILAHVQRTFAHVAEAKELAFNVEVASSAPAAIETDGKRLQQVLKNLLANAFKFTHQGSVELRVDTAGDRISFAVRDTGIGIPQDKQQLVFEAFQQADGSTSRRYGGTGLGLAISREIARLLGGEIRLESAPGQGSVFSLVLPLQEASGAADSLLPSGPRKTSGPAALQTADPPRPEHAPAASLVQAQAAVAQTAALLVVAAGDEMADHAQGRAQALGWRVVPARGCDAITVALQQPVAAVLLDLQLADIDGWRLLDRFVQDLRLRHLPVCVIDSIASTERAQQAGAWGLCPAAQSRSVMAIVDELHAWLARPRRRLLVCTGDAGLRARLDDVLSPKAVEVLVVDDHAAAQAALASGPFDALVGEVAPATARAWIQAQRTGPAERDGARTMPVVCTSEQADIEGIVDAAMRHLHLPYAALPPQGKALAERSLARNRKLHGRRVLIVDDDMRNIYALATVLEDEGMDIVWADDGREAIERVTSDGQIAIVLMDLMMPQLDGMSTIREIRRLPQGRDLPLVVVTAKAMKGDREQCIAAGAWDYLAKPVHRRDLVSMMRMWLR